MSYKSNMFEDGSESILIGEILSDPELKYDEESKIHYYEFMFDVLRKSFTIDKLPVRINVDYLEDTKLRLLGKYTIYGEVITENKFIKNRRKLIMYDLANKIESYVEESHYVPAPMINMFTNYIKISGTTVKLKEFRETPLGRKIREVLIAVNKNGHSSYIPCIMWGELAEYPYDFFEVGKHVSFEGRFQSRPYNKEINGVIQQLTAYEVSINHESLKKRL